jgi:predicted GIY-YIG superfamily endonuclease
VLRTRKKKGKKTSKAPARRPLHHRVYVVELRDCDGSGTVGYYVGMTGLPLDERYLRHKNGKQASRFVRRFGVRLAPEFYEHLPAMTYRHALKKEKELFEIMRAEGHRVFGGH